MQHSFHLFLGDDLSSVAESINNHLHQHCDSVGRKFSHVATLMQEGINYTIRQIDSKDDDSIISTKEEGKAYFSQKHNKIVVADPTGDVSSNLYVCIYALLYDDNALDGIKSVVEWINNATGHFIIDIYGITEDLAHLFCSSEGEIKELVYKIEQMSSRTKSLCELIVDLKNDYSYNIKRFLLLQNRNISGLGLDLDKNTLIRILGEYARLSTTNYYDLYSVADIDNPDVLALGISAYWFNQRFFQNFIFHHSLIKLFEREKVDQHNMKSPISLLEKARVYIVKNSTLLMDASAETTDKAVAVREFESTIDNAAKEFLQVVDSTSLSLPEKRAMLAIFLGEDDELLDDSVLLKDLPTIDDCMTESFNLFIDENNRMVENGDGGVLTSNCENGKVRLPLEELRKKRTAIRQSMSFIRKKEERLKEIEKGQKIEEEFNKRLTEKGFVYGHETFKLIHEVVEKPLEETYIPSVQSAKAVDLRKGFSSIRNQGGLGACTSFSMASIFEYILNQGDITKNHCLSPRFLYYNVCDKSIDGTIIDKGSSFYSNIHSLGSMGICEENLCPYDDKFNTKPSEEAFEEAKGRLVTKALNVDVSHRALTAALTEGYPIGISLKVFNSFGHGKKGFVFRPSDKELAGSNYGYHAMVICGYSENEKIYIVRNSWGEAFGDKGYCYIPFSYIEDASLCRQACIVTGVSCADIKSAISEKPKFNIENKDVEYAILRILIDEEKEQLKLFKQDYDSCYSRYMRLLGELTNKGKRDTIMKHALSVIHPTIIKQEVVEDKQIPTKKNQYVIWSTLLAVAIAVLCAIVLPENQRLFGVLIPVLIPAILLWKYPSSKTIKETRSVDVEIPSTMTKNTEIKYLFAGLILDRFDRLRNEISVKCKYLKSYVLNLETWFDEERRTLKGMDEHIRSPFYSLFSTSDANDYSTSIFVDRFTDFWMFERFKNYDIDDDAIVDFKKSLYDDIEAKLANLNNGFTMFDYLSNHLKYGYLNKIDVNTIFSSILNMSMPFVQGRLMPNTKSILFCKVNNSEQDKWSELVCNNYPDTPLFAIDTSIEKITCIQIQKYKLNETVYGEI